MICTISAFCSCLPSHAMDEIVTSLGDDLNGGTLREAINNASSGDRILFDPSLSGGTIFLNTSRGTLLLSKNLTIDASNLPAGITVDGNGTLGADFPILSVTGSTGALKSLSLQNGLVSSQGTGGAACSTQNSNVTFDHCTFSSNRSYTDLGGGACYLNGGRLAFNNCTFSNNFFRAIVAASLVAP